MCVSFGSSVVDANGVDSLTEERGDVEALASYVGVVWFGLVKVEKRNVF
jgi:hypothetical protein